MIEVSFHRLAAKEVREAFAYYAARSRRAAFRFASSLDAAILRIASDPDSHPVELQHFRWARVRQFPFRLVFERKDSERILILALAHTSRRPRYWRGRA